jgi:hypothetical protein
MSTPQAVKTGPRGTYHAVCLAPDPTRMDSFMPLWDARNAAIEMRDAADAAGDSEGFRTHDAEVVRLSKELEQFSVAKWEDEIENLITNVGANDILDKYLKGSSYTQTIRMGLKGTGSAANADTQASHAGWLEQGGTNAPTYTGNRPSITMGSASGRSSVSPATSFAITSSGTVFGCFINNGGSATKDDTSGVLFSAGDFTGGSRAVANLDTLQVTYTLSA